mmetsp:Transcript_7203/g.15206  ORF Transcript_7203/g.15206 Transcript_7203/m.15206 type:complete len:274 (-) Transcript_7203:183-1004(-)
MRSRCRGALGMGLTWQRQSWMQALDMMGTGPRGTIWQTGMLMGTKSTTRMATTIMMMMARVKKDTTTRGTTLEVSASLMTRMTGTTRGMVEASRKAEASSRETRCTASKREDSASRRARTIAQSASGMEGMGTVSRTKAGAASSEAASPGVEASFRETGTVSRTQASPSQGMGTVSRAEIPWCREMGTVSRTLGPPCPVTGTASKMWETLCPVMGTVFRTEMEASRVAAAFREEGFRGVPLYMIRVTMASRVCRVEATEETMMMNLAVNSLKT